MRLRTLLAAAVASALVAGGAGATAQADSVPSPAKAGKVVAWGNAADASAGPAILVPSSLTTPVVSLAANSQATAAVTVDGHLRIWGQSNTPIIDEAPTNVTDAAAVTLSLANGAVLHTDGKVSAWGAPSPLNEVPSDLRAKAVAVAANGTGYAIRPDGTLTTWGAEPISPTPSGLTDLVDISASQLQVLALKADGTAVAWGFEMFPVFNSVPDLGGKKITQITTGPGANGVVLEDGTIELWGMSVPTVEPDFEGKKVVSLSIGSTNAGAVTEDGVVHTWGPQADVNNNVPASLDGKPVSTIAVGNKHAAVIVTAFRDLTKPTVSGTPKVGQTLTATPATFSLTPDSPATGQWFAGADAIAGQTGTTLALTQAMVGKKITYKSTATRGAEPVTSTSNEVGPVASATVASTTTLTFAPATGGYGTERTATATVTKTGGTPTGTVKFKVGSTETSAALTGGKATLVLPKTLAVGTQTVTASYQGDASTAPSTSAAASMTVDKAASKVTAKGKAKGKTKKFAKKVTITVTVKTTEGVSPAGKVTVTLKGSKKVTAKVNAKGKATVTIKKVKHGKHKATVTYAGNANVASAKTSAKFKA